MVKGNGGKPHYMPHSRPTKVVLRHLPYNLTRATQPQLHRQIQTYLAQAAEHPPEGARRGSSHSGPHRGQHSLYRRRLYRARLREQFDLVGGGQSVGVSAAPAVPQVYGKHLKSSPQVSPREREEGAAVRISNWKILAIVPGKAGTAKKPPRPACAYLELRSEEQARVLCSILDGREFKIEEVVVKEEEADGDGDGGGEEDTAAGAKESLPAVEEDEADDKAVSSCCVCEITTTRDKRRKPLKVNHNVGTLEEDAHFLEFVENMEKDKSIKLPSAEVALEAEQAEAAEGKVETDAAMKPTTLGKYLEEKLRDSKSSKWKKKPKPKATGRAAKKGKAEKHSKKNEKGKPGQSAKDGAKNSKQTADKTSGASAKREGFRKKKGKPKQTGKTSGKPPAAGAAPKPAGKPKRSNKRRKKPSGNAAGSNANSNHQTRSSNPSQS